MFIHLKILMLDTMLVYKANKKMKLDYIIVSKNPKLKIASLAENFDVRRFIFDSSNPSWKIAEWKKECEELHLQFHSVSEQGAFVTDL